MRETTTSINRVRTIAQSIQRDVDRALQRGRDFDDLFDALVNVNDDLIDLLNATDAWARSERSSRSAGKRGKGSRGFVGKRKPSAWNQFVASEMPKVLKAHPRFTPQRAMKEVSARWRRSPKNPNRRR